MQNNDEGELGAWNLEIASAYIHVTDLNNLCDHFRSLRNTIYIFLMFIIIIFFNSGVFHCLHSKICMTALSYFRYVSLGWTYYGPYKTRGALYLSHEGSPERDFSSSISPLSISLFLYTYVEFCVTGEEIPKALIPNRKVENKRYLASLIVWVWYLYQIHLPGVELGQFSLVRHLSDKEKITLKEKRKLQYLSDLVIITWALNCLAQVHEHDYKIY